MPLVYADTSALFAFLHPRDRFAVPVTNAVRRLSPDFVYWSLLKFELRHSLRQANTDHHGQTAWNALRAAERTRQRFRWQDLNCERVLESAESLSQQHGRQTDAGAVDFLHVAAARKVEGGESMEFWTCDAAQAEAARLAGLKARLFKPEPNR